MPKQVKEGGIFPPSSSNKRETRDELNERHIRFAVSNVLWHRKKYNGDFNYWAQKYNIVRIKSNYISFNDNTEKDTYEVLVKNY